MKCNIVGLVWLCLVSWKVEGSPRTKLGPRAKGLVCRGGAQWQGPSNNGEGRKAETGNIFTSNRERTSFETVVLVSGANLLINVLRDDPHISWPVRHVGSLSFVAIAKPPFLCKNR